jgi:hypothetical protein
MTFWRARRRQVSAGPFLHSTVLLARAQSHVEVSRAIVGSYGSGAAFLSCTNWTVRCLIGWVRYNDPGHCHPYARFSQVPFPDGKLLPEYNGLRHHLPRLSQETQGEAVYASGAA